MWGTEWTPKNILAYVSCYHGLHVVNPKVKLKYQDMKNIFIGKYTMDKAIRHCLLLFYIMQNMSCESRSVSQLYSDLFSTYKPLVRPVLHASTKVNITHRMRFFKLIYLDQQEEAFAFRGSFDMTWKDEFLTWNPQLYEDTEQITMTTDKLWIPDFILLRVVEDEGKSGSELKAIVKYNGEIYLSAPGKRVVGCATDITTFPFDSQRCDISVQLWTNTVKEVNLTTLPGNVLARSYVDNGAWRFLSYSVTESLSFTQKQRITYSLQFQRLRGYYILNLILPPIILSFLSLMVFLLPPQSGEKLTLSLSILLSYSVLLGTINESLPKVSSSVCVFSVYLLVMFALKAMTVVSSVLVLQLEHNHDLHNKRFLSVLALLKPHNTNGLSNQQNGPGEKHHESTKKAIMVLDRILFWIFSVLTVSASTVVFIAMLVLWNLAICELLSSSSSVMDNFHTAQFIE